MNWIPAYSPKRPKQNEEVLCDLGSDYNFAVMVYRDGVFHDVSVGGFYVLGTEIKRWSSIGKHYDEE